jgi:pimeloyl-ACP methyl ester carboxylesterase
LGAERSASLPRGDAGAGRLERARPGWCDSHCPTLVISGDRDYTPPAAKEGYTALIPNARLVVIEDSGHATPIDQAEAFNACVLDFLAAVGQVGNLPQDHQ